MTFYAVTYTYADDAAALDRVRPEHRAFLAGLAEQGTLFASGPLVDSSPAQALLVFSVGSADEVAALLDDDPFAHHRLVARRDVVEWNPVIGELKDRR